MIAHSPDLDIRLDADAAPQYRGRADEYFHSLLRSLGWPLSPVADDLTLLGFTSCLAGEGVTTLAMQTAVAAAEAGEAKVLIVDAHVAKPSVHLSLSVAQDPGLVDLLSRDIDPGACIRDSRIENVWVLPAGKCMANPAGVYGAVGRIDELAGMLRRCFDLVVFDLPPVADSDAAIPLLAMLDGVVLVVESERVRGETADRVVRKLERAGVALKGVALNKHQNHLPRWLDRAV